MACVERAVPGRLTRVVIRFGLAPPRLRGADGIAGISSRTQLVMGEAAKLWPSLKLVALECNGTFEFTREPEGTTVLLQNLRPEEMIAARPLMPVDTWRVRLMPSRNHSGSMRLEQVLQAYASLNPRVWP